MTPLRQSDERPELPHLPKDLKELGDLAHQLLFEWPIRQAPRLALPGCILAATVLQAGMIVLFSISYTTPSENLPFSPPIYFIPPDSAVARQIAPWLAANDPAVFSPQYNTRDALPAPPPLKYRPSYEEPPPPLRPLPVDAATPLEPPLFPKLTERMFRQTAPAAVVAPQKAAPTPLSMAHWEDELAQRTLQTNTPPPAPGTASLQPALFDVGVSPEGIPTHAVLLESSGDPASDEAASVWIHAQRFTPAKEISWGRVLFLWGSPKGVGGAEAAENTKP